MVTGQTKVFTVKRKGKTYFLHSTPMYYFSSKKKANAVSLPKGYKVKQKKSGLPMLMQV